MQNYPCSHFGVSPSHNTLIFTKSAAKLPNLKSKFLFQTVTVNCETVKFPFLLFLPLFLGFP